MFCVEEMLSTFSAITVLYHYHIVFKVNLNWLLCFYKIMMSVRARVDFLNLVGIFSESHPRMDYLFLEFSVCLANLLESYGS